VTEGGAPRSTAHHGLFVSMGASCPTRPTTGAPQSTTGCLYPQGHPPFHGGTQPHRYIYMESTPYDEGSTPHPIIGCLYPRETRHHGLCVFDLWISSDVKRDQTFQSETDIELDMEQNITRHSFISITKRLFITPEDRAVPAFILVTSSASVSTTYCTTAP